MHDYGVRKGALGESFIRDISSLSGVRLISAKAICIPSTHTHTHIYIYIYTYISRKLLVTNVWVGEKCSPGQAPFEQGAPAYPQFKAGQGSTPDIDSTFEHAILTRAAKDVVLRRMKILVLFYTSKPQCLF